MKQLKLDVLPAARPDIAYTTCVRERGLAWHIWPNAKSDAKVVQNISFLVCLPVCFTPTARRTQMHSQGVKSCRQLCDFRLYLLLSLFLALSQSALCIINVLMSIIRTVRHEIYAHCLSSFQFSTHTLTTRLLSFCLFAFCI